MMTNHWAVKMCIHSQHRLLVTYLCGVVLLQWYQLWHIHTRDNQVITGAERTLSFVSFHFLFCCEFMRNGAWHGWTSLQKIHVATPFYWYCDHSNQLEYIFWYSRRNIQCDHQQSWLFLVIYWPEYFQMTSKYKLKYSYLHPAHAHSDCELVILLTRARDRLSMLRRVEYG